MVLWYTTAGAALLAHNSTEQYSRLYHQLIYVFPHQTINLV